MTAFVYLVRCNFADAARETEWNAWYSGPKLDEMLTKPHFLSVQRFAAAALDVRRKYLALWVVATPDAFTTPEYRADWGFQVWTPQIRDWSRDLYRSPLGADDPLFDIGTDDALYLASFDGMDADAAERALAGVRGRLPGVIWHAAAGLDRSAASVGLRKIGSADRPQPLAGASGLVETVFRPITPRHLAAPKTAGD